MSIFKKLFNKSDDSSEDNEIKEQEVTLSLDDLFVHNFINKGGKFLYSTSPEDTSSHLIEILDENKWENITCLDEHNLSYYLDRLSIEINSSANLKTPVFLDL